MRIFLKHASQSILVQDDSQPRRSGVRLKVLPDGVHGFDHDHTHDEAAMGATGRWRGQLDGVKQLQLDMHVMGARGRVAEDTRALLDVLGDGTSEVTLSVEDEGDVWELTGHLSQVSNVDWHGATPRRSHYCSLGAILVVGRPVWRAPQARRVVFTGSSASGVLTLPYKGDQPFWPTIRISGTTGGLKLRLTAAEEWQHLPDSPDGWVLDTNPAYRRVTDAAGELRFAGTVPYWGVPVSPTGRVGSIEVQATAPAGDYQVVVEYVEENSRAW